MTFSIKEYITETVTKKAKIKYDRSVKQWVGILDHAGGLIYSQRKTPVAVKKELAEVLEEFIVLDLGRKNETKAHKVPGAYRAA